MEKINVEEVSKIISDRIRPDNKAELQETGTVLMAGEYCSYLWPRRCDGG